MSEALPLVDEIEMRSVFAYLEGRGVSTQDLLAQAQLPSLRFEEKGHFVSIRSALRFFALAAQETQNPTLGWSSTSSAPITRIGSWGPSVARSSTLRDSIRIFGDAYSRSANFIDVGLSIERGQAWFWRRRKLRSKDPTGEEQGEQFTMGMMVRIIQRAAGESWTPSAIRLDSASPDWLLRTPELQGASVSLNHDALAISIPLELLDRKLPRIAGPISEVGAPHRDATAPSDFIGSIETVLSSVLPHQSVPLEFGAEIVGTSTRTLRRMLEKEGTSWRQIVDGVRFQRSVELLLNSDRPIADVASELGYSDAAHFTRAFRRWTQESPSEYRRRRVEGGTNA